MVAIIDDEVERVAKAIWEAGPEGMKWDDLYDHEKPEWREMAKAAIAEIHSSNAEGQPRRVAT